MWGGATSNAARIVAVSCLSLAILAPASAAAQSVSEQAALARELFTEGRALMSSHDYTAACPKFEESQRLDPGGGTLLNLALCHEKIGKTASAWAEFSEALRIARLDRRADREAFAQQHVEDLAPKLSRLRVEVPTAVRVPGLTVRRNGVAIDPAVWGEAMPVDPGEQTIEASAPNMVTRRQIVSVAAGGAAASITVEPLSPLEKQRARSHLEYAAFGGAALSLGAGIYFGAHAVSLQSSANDACPSSDRCRAVGVDLGRHAVATGWVSTGFFAGAVVFAAVGTYLAFTGDHAATNAPAATGVRLGPTGVEGTF